MSKVDEAKSAIPFYVAGAVSAAVIPIPVADAVAISGVQIGMMVHITHGIYQKDVGIDTFKGLVAAIMTSQIGIWIWSMVKTIPVFGTAVGIVGQMIVAGSLTAVMGLALIHLLENGQTLTAENMKKAMPQFRSEAEGMAKATVNEYKIHKDALERIKFNQSNDIVENEVRFSFNLDSHVGAILTIKKMAGDIVSKHNLSSSDTSYIVTTEGWESGVYGVVLHVDGLPEIRRSFTKK